eukprot:5171748-Prymnesium_polylepis.1
MDLQHRVRRRVSTRTVHESWVVKHELAVKVGDRSERRLVIASFREQRRPVEPLGDLSAAATTVATKVVGDAICVALIVDVPDRDPRAEKLPQLAMHRV